MVLCTDQSLYTGISTDAEKRLATHASQRGAKYFRARQPQQLVYLEGGHDRSSASRREASIKKLPRSEKIALLDSNHNELHGIKAWKNKLS